MNRQTGISERLIFSLRKEIQEKGLRKVAVAVSGGVDSITLSHILQRTGVGILALHCNFHLRGKESERDQGHVEDFCIKHSIPLLIKDFDTYRYLEENPGISTEMACRELRYKWFKEIIDQNECQRLAVGHNADDNIETLFLNLLRGAGIKGLRGMEKDNGKIWRPLLNIHRPDILEYSRINNLEYVIDSTNLSSDFRRNFLRNEIIPKLKQEWKGFDKALDSSISHLYSANLVIEDLLSKVLDENPDGLSTVIITGFPDPTLLVRRYIEDLAPYTTTPEEIVSAVKANKPHIRQWQLRKGKVLLRNKMLLKIKD